jgi:trk system potassium uptake protein TrkA
MSVLIVGGGKIGAYIASLLQSKSKESIVIEKDKEVYEKLKNNFTFKVIYGDGCSPQVLKDAGIDGAEVVVATTGDDEDNFVVCQLAKYEFDVPKVVARINSPQNEWLFTKEMGIDVSVSVADIIGRMLLEDYSGIELLSDVITKTNLELMRFTVKKGSPAVNKKIEELTTPPDCIFVLILRQGKEIVPKKETEFLENDRILALITDENKDALSKIF